MCRSYWVTTWDDLPERLADVRQYLRDTLGDVDGVDDVVLVASELAGNAIRHSRSGLPGGHFVLQVAAFTDCWHVRVDDMGSELSCPKPDDAEDTAETGRGFAVIAALSRAWGTFGDSAGRTVWAEVLYPADDIVAEFYEGEWAGVLTPVIADDVLGSPSL